MGYVFTPPTYELKPARGGRLLSRYRFPYAYSLIKRGSTYEEVVSPAINLFDDPDVDFIYQGGHIYPISDEEAALLIAAGYTPTLE
jgi:hypothetical protein